MIRKDNDITWLTGSFIEVPDSVLIMVERYAIGRNTYACSEAAELILARLDHCSMQTMRVLQRDIADAFLRNEIKQDFERKKWAAVCEKIELLLPKVH